MYSLNKMGINKQACDVLACVPLVGAECWRRQQTRKKTQTVQVSVLGDILELSRHFKSTSAISLATGLWLNHAEALKMCVRTCKLTHHLSGCAFDNLASDICCNKAAQICRYFILSFNKKNKDFTFWLQQCCKQC